MATDEGADLASGTDVHEVAPTPPATATAIPTATPAAAPGGGRRRAGSAPPSFWHRDHPVFLPLAGFFTGTLLVILVLGVLGLVLKALFDVDLSEHPGPFFVAISALFVLNLLLLVTPHTRRFARYMLFGLLATPVVVGGVAAATLVLLVRNDS